MVLFILFPGFGESHKYWEYKIQKSNKKYKLKKLNFLQQLKKIGKVYVYTPKVYNFLYYDTGPSSGWEDYAKIYCNLFKKPSQITLDDINIDKECKRIYKLLKNKNEKFVPMGHSIGSWFAFHFSNLYPSKCLNTIFLDGSYIIQNNLNTHFKEKVKKTKLKEITNNNLKLLYEIIIQNVKKNRYEYNETINKYIKKILNITFTYYYDIMKKELNGKLKIPTLSFTSLYFDTKTTKNSSEYNEINMERIEYNEALISKNKNIDIQYLINATHHPWTIQKHTDNIIKQLNLLL